MHKNCESTLAVIAVALAMLAAGTTADAQTEFPNPITTFSIPTLHSRPQGITVGPDGNLWFTESAVGRIGRITSAGAVTEFTLPNLFSKPWQITTGPDGNLWFSENEGHSIGQITTSGTITEFPLPPINNDDQVSIAITTGPDGNLWFTVSGGDGSVGIGRITPAGTLTEFAAPVGCNGITAGQDGNLWFTDSFGGQIGRITLSGAVTKFPIPTANSFPNGIALGRDGNLWFTEFLGNQIARITPAGVVTEFPTNNNFLLEYIAPGPDGNLWFTTGSDVIGLVTPAGSITEWILADPQSGGALFPIPVTAGPDGNVWITAFNEGISDYVIASLVPPAVAPLIAKAFAPTDIPLGGVATLTFTVTNLNSTQLRGVSFGDTLPAGMIVATPNALSTSCSGTSTAVSGSSSIALSGAVLPARASCQLSVTVGGVASGTWVNTTGTVTSTEGGTGNTASASLTVDNAPTGPAQMVASLIATLQGMNIPKQGTSLTDQLQQVATDIATNNGLACQDLAAFAHHINAQIGKTITAAQANQLLTAVASLASALKCGP
jgi:uncharacterized repeat protein (TIGR01451 family)